MLEKNVNVPKVGRWKWLGVIKAPGRIVPRSVGFDALRAEDECDEDEEKDTCERISIRDMFAFSGKIE